MLVSGIMLLPTTAKELPVEILDNRILTPLEEAQLNALGFAANTTMNDMIGDLITRSSAIDDERRSLDWRVDMDHRIRMVELLRESREINNTLIVIASLNELKLGISA